MKVAEELAEAFRCALGRQDELARGEQAAVDERHELLGLELEAHGAPADLQAQVARLERGVEEAERELSDLQERLARESEALAAVVGDLHAELVRRCKVEEAAARSRELRRQLAAARQAFSSDLEALGLDLKRASTAQLEAHLPRLAEPVSRRRLAAAQLASEISARARQIADRAGLQVKLDEERLDLARREESLAIQLSSHAPAGAPLPALAVSIGEADLKSLRSLLRHLLEPLLRDLQIERRHDFAPATDPLDEVSGDLSTPRN